MKTKVIFVVLAIIILMGTLVGCNHRSKEEESVKQVKVEKMTTPVEGTWQGEVTFPDWKGYVDDTLAMNSMYSFDGRKGQGTIYLTVEPEVESFDLFINHVKVDTKDMNDGTFQIDMKALTKTGMNTVQVSNITPTSLEKAITLKVPYPTVQEGTLEEVGLSQKPLELINNIITTDVQYGFTSAQLAVVKDGKLVYQNAWGNVNAYTKEGKRIENGTKVTNDTLYDLASNTKMYAVAYGIQYLMDQGKMKLEDTIVDIMGSEFVDNTIEIKYSSWGEKYPGLSQIKEWKSKITVKDVLMHQAGFPDSGHYHNQKFDVVNQKLDASIDNLLFVEDATKEKTLSEGIFKTPLIYEPRTKTLYSDIDYMLLGMVIEKITQKDLNTFLKETYWEPMGLTHITYNPLQNGFAKEDCAATELNGNTRDGLVDFPHIRKDTIQGEVHDEEAYYMMEGISGHAGLFASATDLAKLASVMLTGGYGNHKFFSKNIRDLFIAPQSSSAISYGIGWWREADDKRVWYFGTQAPESTVGHQGWTGTLTMIDFENNMVVVYLTNAINTPIADTSSIDTANDFSGRYYTSSTLGFVPQIIYMGLDTDEKELDKALASLIKDMVAEKQKHVIGKEKNREVPFPEEHAIKKAKKALEDVKEKWNTW